MYPHDKAYLEHHGVMGMHWGFRKPESLRKEAKNYASKAATTKRDVKDYKLAEQSVKKRITSGRSPVDSVTRDADGKIISTTKHKSDIQLLNDLTIDRKSQEQWVTKYEDRAKLALKRSKGITLTSKDIAMKKEIFSEGMYRAGALGVLGIGTSAVAAVTLNGGMGVLGTMLLAGAVGTAMDTGFKNREIKK